MKSYGNIIEAAITYDKMSDSFDYVLRGTKRKTCHTGEVLYAHKDEVIAQLQEEIRNGTFCIKRYHEFDIKENEKTRRIQAIPLRDRIGLNAIMNEVERRVVPSFITDTASSIKGRGGLYLHKRFLEIRKKHPNIKYFYKCDIRKYYQSIDQERLMEIIKKKFREWRVVHVLRCCITMLPSGISIGLRSSQFFGNLLLSIVLDHWIKDEMGCKYYWRYCDDIVVGAESFNELTPYIQAIHERTEEVGLEIKPNEQVFCIDDRPMDFLGYITYSDGRIGIRKHIKKRFARRWKRVKSKTRRRELVGSFFGIAKHAHCAHLFKTITTYNMKDFSQLGINYVSQDGKKMFDCPSISINDLINRTIIVNDFETNVKTNQGEGRYVVRITDEYGKDYKFFTNSTEMKQILDKVKDIGELPFKTTIVRKSIGNNKSKYCFT